MTRERKLPSTRRQCKEASGSLVGIFMASRYCGPRPDAVLRALVRGALAEYITARPEFLAEVGKSLDFVFFGNDREACFLVADAERERLSDLYHQTRRRLPGESLDEYAASGHSWRKTTYDENTLSVLTMELERIREPLRGVSTTEDRS